VDILISYLNYFYASDYILGYQYLYHLIWCSHNLFQIQFYRRIFYNFYWRNIETEDKSTTTRWIVFSISLMVSCFFSFYYNPSDPALSRKYEPITRINGYFKRLSYSLLKLLNSTKIQLNIKYNTLSQTFDINTVHRTLAINSVWRI
jgi:hypothetical protein